jgi:hypothetical protein
MENSSTELRVGQNLAKSVLTMLLVSAMASAGVILAQRKQDLSKTGDGAPRKTESGAEVRKGFKDIPDATEPCTPAEYEWWRSLRIAARDVIRKNGEQAKTRFYLLLYEGQQKSYRVPLKDRSHQLLSFGSEPVPHDKALRMHLTGDFVFSIEFKSDASVGDVRQVSGSNSSIVEDVKRSTQQYVFLPAVRDRAFVSEWGEVKLSFADKWTKKPKDAEK